MSEEIQTKTKETEKALISFDCVIKFLLKDKGNYDIVESFISAFLARQGYGPVKIVGLADTESNQEDSGFKKVKKRVHTSLR